MRHTMVPFLFTEIPSLLGIILWVTESEVVCCVCVDVFILFVFVTAIRGSVWCWRANNMCESETIEAFLP